MNTNKFSSFLFSSSSSFSTETHAQLLFKALERKMDNRNYVNSDYYEKLLRDKIKRESKVAKMQNKILHEQQKQQQKAICPKKPKKLAAEKLFKHQTDEFNGLEKSHSSRSPKRFSTDNDLLNEIDESLQGTSAKGFVYKKGN